MTDAECVAFLQWALPRLRLRWPGFRRVRGQVRKRIVRRIARLELADLDAYRTRLERDPDEWRVLDGLCRITISRFYRDRALFERLRRGVLPDLARRAAETGRPPRCWSVGCASGEEPYSVSLAWRLGLPGGAPRSELEVLGTDEDETLLDRARNGAYPAGTLKDLPAGWRELAFTPVGDRYRLRDTFRAGVAFRRQDVRRTLPEGPFHLVLGRNLVFTYFEERLQLEVLERIAGRMEDRAVLGLGAHERLPPGAETLGLRPMEGRARLYRMDRRGG
jgi:chemotaxis protein methyltransferase CheR